MRTSLLRLGCLSLSLTILPLRAKAQGTWSTLPNPPASLALVTPQDITVDGAGNLYVLQGYSDVHKAQILRRDTAGAWSDVTPNNFDPPQGFSPGAIGADAQGNLYTLESVIFQPGQRIQKRAADGTWSLLDSFTLGTSPLAYSPKDLQVDASGNLYLAESFSLNHAGIHTGLVRIRHADGTVQDIALTQPPGDKFEAGWLEGIAPDSQGQAYTVETDFAFGVARLRRLNADGTWTVLANKADAPGGSFSPIAVAVDHAGNAYVADGLTPFRILKRDATGAWSVLTPSGTPVGALRYPQSLAITPEGKLYILDTTSSPRIVVYTPAGVVSSGDLNGDGRLDLFDLRQALLLALGRITATPEVMHAADLNGDGSVNVADAILLIRRVLGFT